MARSTHSRSIFSLLLLHLCTAAPTGSSGVNSEASTQLWTTKPKLSLLLEPFDPTLRVAPQTAEYYRGQGQQLVRLMMEPEGQKLDFFESPFVPDDIDDPDGGWIVRDNGEAQAVKFEQLMPGLEGLTGVAGFTQAQVGLSLQDPEDRADESIIHCEKRIEYRNLIGDNRFIFSMVRPYVKVKVVEATGTELDSDGGLPRWSDVTLLRYAGSFEGGEFEDEDGEGFLDFLEPGPNDSETKVKKPIPYWFLLHDVEKAREANAMVQYCMQTMRESQPRAWPGTTFPAGSDCYFNLLGTETCAEVTMFFIKHRKVLGRAVLGSVTVFKDGDGKTNMLWWATNNADDLHMFPDVFRRNEGAAVNSVAPSWPVPMKPIHEGER